MKFTKTKVWVKADLHVHTPASKDYRGEKSENEFRKILSKVTSTKEPSEDEISQYFSAPDGFGQGIQLIAITDHNSIDGFVEIMSIKQETQQLYEKLKDRESDLDNVDPVLNKLKTEIETYNNVHILMGVEVKADPGVHLIIIFEESVMPSNVEEFLDKCFEEDFIKIKGDPEPMVALTIKQLLDDIQEEFKEKAFVLAPHADSSSGLFEVCKKLAGPKKNALMHPIFKAISLNNFTNKARYEEIINSPHYKKDGLITFIQSSDFHGEPSNDIGLLHAEIMVDDGRVNYSNLVAALEQEDHVKCSSEFVMDTYNRLIENRPIAKYKSDSDESIEFNKDEYTEICENICAYLNNGPGLIEIEGSLKNMNDKPGLVESFRKHLRNIMKDRIDPAKIYFGTRFLPLNSNKYILLSRISKSQNLHMTNGQVYTLKDKQSCSASPNEIEYIVSRNSSRRWGRHNETKLDNLADQTRRLSKAQTVYPLIIKCEHKLKYPVDKAVQIEHLEPQPYDMNIFEQKRVTFNGYCDGNIETSLEELTPRNDNAYMRFTTPRYRIDDDKLLELPLCEVPEILVHAGGGVTIVSPDTLIYSHQLSYLLKFPDKCDRLLLLAWFKSSFFIYYCCTILGALDVSLVLAEKPSEIPTIKYDLLEAYSEPIIRYVNKIIEAEEKSLKAWEDVIDGKLPLEKLGELVNKHNENINSHAVDLDIIIFKILGLAATDAYHIYKGLNDLNIYTYGENLDERFIEKFEVIDNN